MFYLVQFFKFISFNGLSGYLFFILSTTLVVASLSSHPLTKLLQERFQVEKPLLYFHALVSGEQDMDIIRYKLLRTPYVKRVSVKSSEYLQRQAKELLIDLGLEELHREEKYQGLQVFLSPHAQFQNRIYSLTKQYMAHLLGDLSVSFSGLKVPDTSLLKTKQSSINFLQQWAYMLFLLLLGILWAFSLWNISTGLRKYSFIIEEYQRRSYVSFKIMLAGLLVVSGLSFSLFFTEIKVNVFPAMIVFSLMLMIAALFCLGRRWE